MNDELLIIFYILMYACIIIGVILAKVECYIKHITRGAFCALILFILSSVLNFKIQREYENLPYLEEPIVYELSENDMQSIFQTGEANSITFFDSDGYAHTIKYSELSKKYEENVVPSVLVYYRDEDTKWMFRKNIPKIVILLPEIE